MMMRVEMHLRRRMSRACLAIERDGCTMKRNG